MIIIFFVIMKKLKLKERSNNLPEVVQLDTGAGI
jgi:hypothetical protein